MADDLDDFYVHTITVQTRTGSGSYGDVFAAPVTLSPATDTGVFADDKRKLVRSSTGAEVISETTIYGRTTAAEVLLEGSLVTLPSGRVATVITTALLDSGGMDLPDHTAATLT